MRIFISYRRDDGAADARNIHDRLSSELGADGVFMDVDKLRPGQRFDRALEQALLQCDVFLAVIGPRWLELFQKRVADGERDFVRDEIATAISRDIVVIPLLIDRARLPRTDALPIDIQPLLLHQAHSLTHERFGRDIEELISAIKITRGTAAAAPTARPTVPETKWVPSEPTPAAHSDPTSTVEMKPPLDSVEVSAAMGSPQSALPSRAERAAPTASGDPVAAATRPIQIAIGALIAGGAVVLGVVVWALQSGDTSAIRDCQEPSSTKRQIEACAQMIADRPKSSLAHNNLCQAYNQVDDGTKALSYCNTAIRLDPRNVSAYNNRGWAYEIRKEYDLALKDYDKAIELDPKFAVAFANRGDVYAKKGDRDRAILEYRQALVLEPGNDVALSGLQKLGAKP